MVELSTKGYCNTEWKPPARVWRGQSWDDFLPNYYPNVEGWLEGVPLFVVCTGPSMDQIPDVWQKMATTPVLTVGINHAIKLFSPTFWTAYDREYYNEKYDKYVEGYSGIPIWEWRYSACKRKNIKRLNANTKSFDFEKGDMYDLWGNRGMEGLIPAGQSDCYALEIFSGLMHASPVYLLGVDYFRDEDKTQCSDVWDGMDAPRKHLSDKNMGRYGDTYRERNKRCHAVALQKAKESGREVYTCVPDDRSITHETFSYVPFEDALAQAEGVMEGKEDILLALRKHVDVEGVDQTWGSFPAWCDKEYGKGRTESVKRFYSLK